MRKKIMAFFAAGVIAVSLAGCGQQPPQTEQTSGTQTSTTVHPAEGDIALPQTTLPHPDEAQTHPDEVQTAASTTAAAAPDGQFGPLFQQFVRDKVSDGSYTLKTEQAGMRMNVSVSGKNSALESDAAGILHFTIVSKDGQYFMVMHTTKKYAQMTAEEYAKQADSLENAALQLDNLRLRETGSETVNGKTYRTETYDEGDLGTVTYFFDDTGVRRTRVVKDGKTSMADVFEVSDEADAAAFEVPAGYTFVPDSAHLLAQ